MALDTTEIKVILTLGQVMAMIYSLAPNSEGIRKRGLAYLLQKHKLEGLLIDKVGVNV